MLAESNVHGILMEVFPRLHVLRNRIFHGGADVRLGMVERVRIRDGSRIMATLVPEILGIMRADIEANPDSHTWGKVACPRIDEAPDSGR